jgi:hypothetical protein
MSRVQSAFLTVFIAGAVLLTGCDAFLGSSQVEGQLRVLMTDAPKDIVEANVTIERVELVGGGQGVLVLSNEEQSFNLLELQDGVTAELADVSTPEGSYGQLRIIVNEEAHIVLEDESEYTLKVPSGAQTGIKMSVPEFEIADDDDAVEILVDFDVEESFVYAGATETYIFKPVIKPVYIEVNGVVTEVENGGEE